MAASTKIYVDAPAGLDIALVGMLRSAGLSTALGGDRDERNVETGDVTIEAEDGGTLGLSVSLFKAMQLVQSRDFEHVFENYIAFD